MRNKYQTSFPMARIKRIMQHDDEVGKVALAAPLVISKALEIFMQSLLTKSAEKLRASNGRRLLPVHLKRVIESTEQFDFLGDLVKTIPDIEPESERGGRRRREGSAEASPTARRRTSQGASASSVSSPTGTLRPLSLSPSKGGKRTADTALAKEETGEIKAPTKRRRAAAAESSTESLAVAESAGSAAPPSAGGVVKAEPDESAKAETAAVAAAPIAIKAEPIAVTAPIVLPAAVPSIPSTTRAVADDDYDDL